MLSDKTNIQLFNVFALLSVPDIISNSRYTFSGMRAYRARVV